MWNTQMASSAANQTSLAESDGRMSEHASLVQQFINYLRAERHFSPHTAKCYAADLQQFCGYLCTVERFGPVGIEGGNGKAPMDDMSKLGPPPGIAGEDLNRRLLGVETDDVRSLMGRLRDHNYCKSTIARKLATLRSFYKFLVRRGYLTNNPVAPIRTPKQDKRLPKCLEVDQIEKLLAAAKG